MNYQDYLQSVMWKARRDAAIERAGGCCQICHSDAPLEVHHNTYERLGAEEDSDLIALCADCHEHNQKRLPSMPFYWLSLIGVKVYAPIPY